MALRRVTVVALLYAIFRGSGGRFGIEPRLTCPGLNPEAIVQ
jgi:hypothetical protein